MSNHFADPAIRLGLSDVTLEAKAHLMKQISPCLAAQHLSSDPLHPLKALGSLDSRHSGKPQIGNHRRLVLALASSPGSHLTSDQEWARIFPSRRWDSTKASLAQK